MLAMYLLLTSSTHACAFPKQEVESFAKRDPYVLNNLVTSWYVAC